jgi:hypothetical protein
MNKLTLTLLTVGIAGLLVSTAMAGQPTGEPEGAPAPGTQVVDSKGTVVGNLFSGASVIRQINRVWVEFQGVIRDGIEPESQNNIQFIYTSSNCSGTPYLDATSIPISGYAIGSAPISKTVNIYYPAPPYQSLLISSRTTPPGSPNNCQTIPPEMVDVGAVASASLTVVPPLSVR